MKRPNDPDASQSPTPPIPSDLDGLYVEVTDAIYDYYRTRAGLRISIEYLRLCAAHPNDGPMVEPSSLSFALQDTLSHLEDIEERLNLIQGGITTIQRAQP